MSEEAPLEFVEFINELGLTFDSLCQERHEEGAKKYGPLKWAENDVIRMMVEELADTVNYCRYQAIKLMLLQYQLEEHLEGKLEGEQELTLGFAAFKGTKDVGWHKR